MHMWWDMGSQGGRNTQIRPMLEALRQHTVRLYLWRDIRSPGGRGLDVYADENEGRVTASASRTVDGGR